MTGVDYRAAEAAILHTMGMNATNMYLDREGFYKYGYVPADVGTVNYLSRGLEFSTQLEGLAHLGYVLGDRATYNTYYPWGKAYLRTWNPASKIFQARNTDGSWAPANAGLFEGTTTNYAFDEPQDGLGLAAHLRRRHHEREDRQHLRRSGHLVQRLPAGAAVPRHLGEQPVGVPGRDPELLPPRVQLAQHVGEPAQQRLGVLHRQRQRGGSRQPRHLPDSVAGAQWILNSPAVTRAVIHGRCDTIIQAPGNSPSTPYVSSIEVNGSAYPSHFISGETLATRNNTLTFGMTGTPSRIGQMYLTGTDGEILSASTDNRTYLRFRNDPLGGTSQAEVYAARAPVAVSVNGVALPSSDWSYNSGEHVVTLKDLPVGAVLVQFRRT